MLNLVTEWDKPLPEPEWLVPGLLPAGEVCVLAGEGGVGKSFLALQLSLAMARGGREWVEWLPAAPDPFDYPPKGVQLTSPLHTQCRPGRVLYLSWEDSASQFQKRMGVLIPPAASLCFGAMKGEGELYNETTPTVMGGQLANRIRQLSPSLVVVDTAGRAFKGDGNDANQVTHFIDWLGKLTIEYGCTILMLCHYSKTSGTTQGSSAWRNAPRAQLCLEQAGTRNRPVDGVFSLSADKENYSTAQGSRYSLTKQPTGYFEYSP